MKMIVSLQDLRPNPFRDFAVDPIDGPENDNAEIGYVSAVTKLRESIEQDGFWGGVVVNQVGDDLFIIAGHHRIEAAKLAGLKTADLVVFQNLDANSQIRIYGRENATQRGASSHALTGTVAAALRKVAMDHASTQQMLSTKKNVGSDSYGIGEPAIMEILGDIHGIGTRVVREQIVILKQGGHYRRIMDEMAEDARLEAERIEREAEEARLAAEQAEKEAAEAEERRLQAEEKARAAKEESDRRAAEKRAAEEAVREQQARQQAEVDRRFAAELKQQANAAQRAEVKAAKTAEKAQDSKFDQIFDYDGVSQWLKNDNQIRAFRMWATGEGIRPYLPVASQHMVAEALVAHAAKYGLEISAAYINQRATEMLLGTKAHAPKAKPDLQIKSWEQKMAHWVDEFGRHCRGLLRAGTEIAALMKTKPKGATVRLPGALKNNVREARDVLITLFKSLYGE